MSIHLTDDKPVVYHPYRLSHSERQNVKKIVDDLLENKIIPIYDPKLKTEVHTDASKWGIGGILLQEHDNKLKPVMYYSRQTSKEEQRSYVQDCYGL
ncbi:hypothetical protein NQ315_012927 [Exocentrus adspersus]|uniref:Reverse transcriptase/retrotransposon-derived protein RNase H-like domain-containing protein n=1 Tax=Exocentrus adspersus TaxID=1586481 RepID=A0AAV8VSA5_9CUCU|nr:hypothetical protein NQ315_012927 [Exocentrus adspersus]